MARLTLRLLGGFETLAGDASPRPLTVRKAQALLAFLALPPGQAHPRDKIAALLWGDVPEPQARANFRQALATLRRGLGAAANVLSVDGASVSLDPAAVDVDAVAFERETKLGTPEALVRASTLYRGDL